MSATLNAGMNDVRELTADELTAISGAMLAISLGDLALVAGLM
jgi:hypothetical protein